MSGLNLRDLASDVVRLREELRRCRREVVALRSENEILREAAAPLIYEAPARQRFAFMHQRRARFGAHALCRVLVVDRGDHYSWVRRQGRRDGRAHEDRRLTELIVEVHAARPAYGAPCVRRELQRLGVPVGRSTVARLMRQKGISGVTRRRWRNLTKPDVAAAVVPDKIVEHWDVIAPIPAELPHGNGLF